MRSGLALCVRAGLVEAPGTHILRVDLYQSRVGSPRRRLKKPPPDVDTSCMIVRHRFGPPIPLLIPDMPEARDVLPWLEEIDRTRWYTNGGPLVRELEAGLVELVCSRFPGGELHGVAVSSGTTALALGLAGLGMGVGHRVMLPALTFPATATTVRQVGSREVLVDVDPDSWSLTPDIARAALRHVDVDLIVPVAAFGRPQSVDAWDAFIEETGVPVLIDAAAAFGSQAVGRHTAVAFSLHATKVFGIGEGGFLMAASQELIESARRTSNFGFDGGTVQVGGCNGKLSEYHAAVGLAQLHRFERVEERRRSVWASYRSRLHGSEWVELQQADSDFVRSVLTVKVLAPGGAEELERRMMASNVQTRRWYHPPLYAHPAFAGARCVGPDGGSHLPETTELANLLLGLPFHTLLGEAEIAQICSVLHEIPAAADALSLELVP